MGTVSAGMGTVWENRTRGIPMANPSNPSSEEYDDRIPQNVASAVVLHGCVTGVPSTSPDGSWKFPLTVSEYVRDTIRQSHLQYVFILLVMTEINTAFPVYIVCYQKKGW